jgi:hypothetical protein
MRRPPIDAVTILDLIAIPTTNARLFEDLADEIIEDNGGREILVNITGAGSLCALVGLVIRQRMRLGLM